MYHENIKKGWATVYPIYFNSSKSSKQGRKVSKDLCHEHPKLFGLELSAKILELPIEIERSKTHPQDWSNPGRLRFRILDEQEKPIKLEIKDKKALLKALGKIMIENINKINPVSNSAKVDQNSKKKKKSKK